jgi:hypothetical protein
LSIHTWPKYFQHCCHFNNIIGTIFVLEAKTLYREETPISFITTSTLHHTLKEQGVLVGGTVSALALGRLPTGSGVELDKVPRRIKRAVECKM